MYLRSVCSSFPKIGKSSKATSRPGRTLPYSFITQGAQSHLDSSSFFSRYVTPLIANLKKLNGGEISAEEIHLATGTMDTNTFEVVCAVEVDDGDDDLVDINEDDI